MSKEPRRNVYVGHRYVPKIFGEWNNKNDYEGLSIVTYKGTSYTSKKYVPVGIDISNEEFWVVTGNYNAQVEYYRRDVNEYRKDVNEYGKDVDEYKQETDKNIDNLKQETDKNIDNLEQETTEQIDNIKQETSEDLAQRGINVKTMGAKGDGETDDTDILQQALNEFTNIYIPDGKYIISKPLYFEGYRHITGSGNRRSIIQKRGHGTLTNDLTFTHRNNHTLNYNDYDAIIMSIGYTGDFIIEKLDLRGTSSDYSGDLRYTDKNEYGLFIPYSYRVTLSDLEITACHENIRFYSTWNTNIKKVRSRFSDYAFRVEGVFEPANNPIQSTSIHFDNTFAEYAKVGYKLLNVTYFSGSAMSCDFVDEVCYWFDYSSGGINGLGIEGSEGQFIRNWRSNVAIHGMFLLNNYQKQNHTLDSKSLGKFEIWSTNRNNTGLLVTSLESRDGLKGNGNHYMTYVSGQSSFTLMNSNTSSLTGSISEPNVIESNSHYNVLSNGSVSLKGYYRSIIGDIDLNNELLGYNEKRYINNVDGFIYLNTLKDVELDTIHIPLTEIKKRFPNFAHEDHYLTMPIKLTIVFGSSGLSIIDNYIRNRTYIGDYQKTFTTSIKVDDVTITDDDLVIHLTEPISRFKIYLTLP